MKRSLLTLWMLGSALSAQHLFTGSTEKIPFVSKEELNQLKQAIEHPELELPHTIFIDGFTFYYQQEINRFITGHWYVNTPDGAQLSYLQDYASVLTLINYHKNPESALSTSLFIKSYAITRQTNH